MMSDGGDLATLKAAREQIATGKITAITFWPTDGGWQTNARRPDGSWAVGHAIDPFDALADALGRRPMPQAPADDFEDLL